MMLNASEIKNRLEKHPGNYVLRDGGTYRLKNADGSDMLNDAGPAIRWYRFPYVAR